MTLKVDAAAAAMPDTVPRAYGGVRLSE
jgi:hypothetical protein